MALITIDLSDELAERVRAAELDVSAIAQAAVKAEMYGDDASIYDKYE